MMFPTRYKEILQRIDNVEPELYGRTRNYIDGHVTYLSPYISRGVISVKFVLERLLHNGYEISGIEKFIQELAWREYWQQVWIAKGSLINEDLKSEQDGVENQGIPNAIVEGKTGIEAIDDAVGKFYDTGYIHNQVRMYIASIACNIGRSHWKTPARWMYYYLLDADWASNALSWQWVAGSNSSKKYYANQENINKFYYTDQQGTFLDADYSVLPDMPLPQVLKDTGVPELNTKLPDRKSILLNKENPVLIYNIYNLDPNWKKDQDVNRILLLEPSHFDDYPVSDKTINFILSLGENIKDLKVYVGEFDEFVNEHEPVEIYFKEHPLNNHYRGVKEEREWLFSVKGYYPSFFKFWSKCKKEISSITG